MINTCSSCPQGSYSTVQDDTCQDCMAGYLCYGRTNKKYPTIYNQHNGEICPKGFYCPGASFVGTACPIGTYNSDFGAITLT